MKARDLKSELDLEMATWAAEAAALKAHLELDLALAMERVERVKKQLADFLDDLKMKASDERATLSEGFDRVISTIQHLQVQIALAKAETRDAYREQKFMLRQAIEDLHRTLDHKGSSISEGFAALTAEFTKKAHALEIEFAALELQLIRRIEDAHKEVHKERQELGARIQEFQAAYVQGTSNSSEKAEETRKRLEHGIRKVRAAFHRILEVWGRVGLPGD
jgi:hypothetical protein